MLNEQLQTELDQEAKAEAKKLTGRVPIFRMGYEAGHYDGAGKYAEKWQEAEQRAERYEKALKLIRDMDHISPDAYAMKLKAYWALTPKQPHR